MSAADSTAASRSMGEALTKAKATIAAAQATVRAVATMLGLGQSYAQDDDLIAVVHCAELILPQVASDLEVAKTTLAKMRRAS